MAVEVRATLDDLYRIQSKAELIGGRLVEQMPTGEAPNWIAGLIFSKLLQYVQTTGRGRAYTDGVGYAVAELPSGRESFSPDASFYDGPLPANRMRFIDGAPTFAVEVRSESDYGPVADDASEAKREDYFLAGTLVVWDIDPLSKTVTIYRRAAPGEPVVCRPGDLADAEPALPGWRLDVAWLFAS